MSSYNRILSELTDLVQSEHCEACCEDHCDINASFDTGHFLWAINMFESCGAAGDRFTLLFARLIAQYGKRFERAAERERVHFCDTVPYITCEHCNAVTWITPYTDATYYTDYGAQCGSCLGPLPVEVADGAA